MLKNLCIFLHMQNGRICLAASGAAGAWGEPGNGIPPSDGLSEVGMRLTGGGPCL